MALTTVAYLPLVARLRGIDGAAPRGADRDAGRGGAVLRRLLDGPRRAAARRAGTGGRGARDERRDRRGAGGARAARACHAGARGGGGRRRRGRCADRAQPSGHGDDQAGRDNFVTQAYRSQPRPSGPGSVLSGSYGARVPLSDTRLQVAPYDFAAAERLCEALGVSHVAAQVLVRRGLGDPAAARTFFDADVRPSARRIRRAA